MNSWFLDEMRLMAKLHECARYVSYGGSLLRLRKDHDERMWLSPSTKKLNHHIHLATQ